MNKNNESVKLKSKELDKHKKMNQFQQKPLNKYGEKEQKINEYDEDSDSPYCSYD